MATFGFVFDISGDELETDSGIFGVRAEINLPVVNGARDVWDVHGIDYSLDLVGRNWANASQNIAYSATSGSPTWFGSRVGIFGADQGALVDDVDSMRDIDFSFGNGTLIDKYATYTVPYGLDRVEA